ncbi:hypothetical protein BH11MYX3_BH11MYX3_26650 [soil metagenome]
MRRTLALALILASTHAARGQAPACDPLAEAQRLEAALDYDKALAIVERVLAGGGAASPDRFVELHLFAGRLAAGLERVTVAEGHYLRALAVKPDATLPEGTSPKLIAPLDAARRSITPLRISVIAVAGAVSFLVDSDALGLVRGIALTVVDAHQQRRELVDRSALRMAVPSGTTAIEVAALDAQGNRVVEDVPPAALVSLPPREQRLRYSEPPSIPLRWSTWAIATGVVLGAGALSAWRFNVAQNDWDRMRAEPDRFDYSELITVEDRGRRWGLAANLSFGVAALTGIAAIVLYAGREPPHVLLSGTGIGGEF